MFREWWHPDPTQSPWKTVQERGYVSTTCLFCEHDYGSVTATEDDRHYAWCKWWKAYTGYLQQQTRTV